VFSRLVGQAKEDNETEAMKRKQDDSYPPGIALRFRHCPAENTPGSTKKKKVQQQ